MLLSPQETTLLSQLWRTIWRYKSKEAVWSGSAHNQHAFAQTQTRCGIKLSWKALEITDKMTRWLKMTKDAKPEGQVVLTVWRRPFDNLTPTLRVQILVRHWPITRKPGTAAIRFRMPRGSDEAMKTGVQSRGTHWTSGGKQRKMHNLPWKYDDLSISPCGLIHV